MLHYYLNLPKNKPKNNNISFDNFEVSKMVLKNARRSFEPFEEYLSNAITALENKKVEAIWKKVDTSNRAQLFIIGGLYEVLKKTVICISGAEKFDKTNWSVVAVELDSLFVTFKEKEAITNDKGGKYNISSIDMGNRCIIVEGELSTVEEKLFYQEIKIVYTIIKDWNMPIPQGVEIDKGIIYSDKKLSSFKEIDEFEKFINDSSPYYEGKPLDAKCEEKTLVFEKAVDLDNIAEAKNKFITINKMKFNVKKSKEVFRIQLEIDQSKKDDNNQTISPLKHFFSDGKVSVEDKHGNIYSVTNKNETDSTLILKSEKKKDEEGKRKSYCFPEGVEGEKLTVRVNTYPLKKQLEAIATLKSMPMQNHALLIKLFEDRSKISWHPPSNIELSYEEWYVIKDKRSGYDQQQNFVQKALGTNDFAILEGPPGSGKTTVILELICQIIKRGERVLLCGSTHVAIDNILERLKEKALLEKYGILPVRIGDVDNINEYIQEFQIDNLCKNNKIDKELLLSASNLVCGTTIGILQHPKFRERKGKLDKNEKGKYQYFSNTPIVPEFDYLIIDESSKTTFQEFLVPALYAKKWILAGDVMQLSPYTEREEIVSNIANLTLSGEPVALELQNAVFYLHKLKEYIRGDSGENHFVLPVKSKTIHYIHSELTHDKQGYFKDNFFLFITKNELKNCEQNILSRSLKEINFLEMAISDIIFVDEDYLSDILPHLSERHAILIKNKEWKENEHVFIHNAYQQTHKFCYWYKQKGKEYKEHKNSFEIVKDIEKYFEDKKGWAEEIAWRIEREHQLVRLDTGRRQIRYTEIEEFIPKSLDMEAVKTAVNNIAEMAFPSILESLVRGIEVSKKNKGRKREVESTISKGFKDFDLTPRKTTLEYQHRMHSKISFFPRKQFYEKFNISALKDPIDIDKEREWNYKHYNDARRSIWVDVPNGKETNDKENVEEVKKLIQHLKAFIDYAQNNRKRDSKEWEIACLTCYTGQERKIRDQLRDICENKNGYSNFSYKKGNNFPINIKLHTVDKFQGHEADVVFLSMVRTEKVGFMDYPNRLNVAITRAKYQLVIFGKREFFLKQHSSEDLKELAKNTSVYGDNI